MPKLPVVSGPELIKFMQRLGYRVARQRGSHVQLRMENDLGAWSETVPNHREIAKGTLNGILKRIAFATQSEISDLIDELVTRK